MPASRLVILTDQYCTGFAERAVEGAIQLVHTQTPAVICKSEDCARYELLHGSDRLDTPLILIVGAKGASACQSVFRTHVKMRSRDAEFEPWHGGLIVFPLDRAAEHALDAHDLYRQLSGHVLLRMPVNLVDLLISCREVGRLYPRYWQIVVERSGLRTFWDCMQAANESLENGDLDGSSRELRFALAQIIEEGALRYLVPHAEVLRKIRSANRKLHSIGVGDATALARIGGEVTSAMSDYTLGTNHGRLWTG